MLGIFCLTGLALGEQEFHQLAVVSGTVGTAEVWSGNVAGTAVVVLKVKEAGKEGEVNATFDKKQLTVLNQEVDKLLSDRRPLKAGSVIVLSTVPVASGTVDVALVRPGKDTLRVLVVKDGKSERTFSLDPSNRAAFKRALEQGLKTFTKTQGWVGRPVL